jgi:DNA-3-methyladenine glycosylase II
MLNECLLQLLLNFKHQQQHRPATRTYFRMASTRKRSQQQQQNASATLSIPVNNKNNSDDLEDYVHQLLIDSGMKMSGESSSSSTITRSGWCLKEGLIHVMSADNGKLKPLVEEHGPPKIFTSLSTDHCRHDDNNNNTNDNSGEEAALYNEGAPKNCFQSLCRIVSGQQLAGAAARAVWNRLLQVTETDLAPIVVLALAKQGLEDHLRKPAGLSNAKARSIVALSEAFERGELSEEFLTDTSNDEDIVREALLKIKGIGPWSCDMFLMFYLEKPNVIPIGDLGVRKGMQRFCSLRGKAKGGSLCQKKDLDVMLQAARPYHPYQSIFSYYMWKVADTPDFYGTSGGGSSAATPKKKKAKVTRQVVVTPCLSATSIFCPNPTTP